MREYNSIALGRRFSPLETAWNKFREKFFALPLNMHKGGLDLHKVNQALIKELTWVLMLIPIGIIVGAGIFYLCRMFRRAKFEEQLLEPSELEEEFDSVAPSLGLSPFEQACRWLAIRGESLGAVQAALNLRHVVQCSWEEGLGEAHEDKLFISPPISGWILVVGLGLPDPSDDVDRCYLFLTALSRRLGQVQFFSSNRVLNHHAWVLVEKGSVTRAYAWADETVWNQGQMTASERDLEMRCFDYGTEVLFTHREILAANAEKVTQLAARWSIDPSAICESNWKAGTGIVGEFRKKRVS